MSGRVPWCLRRPTAGADTDALCRAVAVSILPMARWNTDPAGGAGKGACGDRNRESREPGAVTIFVAVAMIGLLAMAGLVVDGAAKVRAVQRADRVAVEAARAAGQTVDLAGLLAGEPLTVDRRAAATAARRYLDAAGVEGSVEAAGGASLRVTTRTSERTVFLGLIGIHQLEVSGQAEVRLTTQREGSR